MTTVETTPVAVKVTLSADAVARAYANGRGLEVLTRVWPSGEVEGDLRVPDATWTPVALTGGTVETS